MAKKNIHNEFHALLNSSFEYVEWGRVIELVCKGEGAEAPHRSTVYIASFPG